MELESIFKDGTCGLMTVEATVDTGFENVALDECLEMFGSGLPIIKSRGRVYFVIHQDDYEKVNVNVNIPTQR